MEREKALNALFSNLNLLLKDLYSLILQYEKDLLLDGKYLFEWDTPRILHLVHDNQYLYTNCLENRLIYQYSFDGKLLNTLPYETNAMELINNQLYLADYIRFFILDIKSNVIIEEWNLPKEENESIGGWSLKIDQENVFIIPHAKTHEIYLFLKKNGKEIKKFGSKKESQELGQFDLPFGLTVNEKYLYVCDFGNDRIQVLNKKNGRFISQWKSGDRLIVSPKCILLHENYFYVGDKIGIQVFTSEGVCHQVFGKKNVSEDESEAVMSICIVNERLYANRDLIQVFS